ncbi:MAG: PAS domain S-box protein [Longimicrobiales bacterium]
MSEPEPAAAGSPVIGARLGPGAKEEIPTEAVLLERNRLLYGALPASIAATLALAAVLAVIQADVIPTVYAAGWFVAISVLNLGRLVVARGYENRADDPEWVEFYDREFIWSAVAGGIGWGAAGLLLFPPDIVHQAFLGFVVAGVTAGSLGSLSPSFTALAWFLILSLAPLALRLGLTDDTVPVAMGAMTALFLGFLVLSGRRVATMVNDNIRLRFLDARREAETRRANELLERVGRIARIGGWEWDQETDTVRWSEQVYRLYGRAPNDPVDFEAALAAYPEADRLRLAEASQRALEERQPYDLELRFDGADPDVRWVRTRGEPVIEDGSVVRLTGTVQDITERRETANRLRSNLDALQRLYTITARADTTLAQKIEGILELGLDIFGLDLALVSRIQGDRYTVEHAAGGGDLPEPGARFDLGETYCSHVYEADGPVAFDHAGEAIAGHPCYQQFGLEAYIGAPIVIAGERHGTLNFSSPEPRSEPFTEHHFALIQIFAEWIGHEMGRVRALAGLAESEERTRLILQSVGEGIYGLDRDGRTTFVNPTAVEILGYQPEEILGRSMHDLVHHSYEDGTPHPVEECPTIQTFVDGETVTIDDDVLWTKDGDAVPVEYTSTPVWKGEALVGAVVSFRDITERKEIERLKNEFVSTVSHELRTPLTSIRGSLGLVAGGAAGELPERAAELVRIAARNSERLILLINDILDMEKIESGKLEFSATPQPIMPLVEQAVEANEAFAAEHEAAIVVTENVAADVKVNVDENRMQQALTNLISNAAKFTDEGTEVELAVGMENGSVRIAVTDHGPGISEEFRDRIFERFSQADSSDQRKKGGTGLGLSITRALVERMGGRIWFDTETGVGTTFTIQLPVWVPAGAQRAGRILICEPDQETGAAVVDVLRGAGYEPIHVTDAVAARERLADAEAPYDALILDLSLPDGEGIDLVRWVRSTPATEGLPVVAMTADMAEGRLRLGGELRLVDWLDKPVRPADLEAILGQLKIAGGGLPDVLHVEDDEDLRHTVAAVARDLATFHPAGTLDAAREALGERPFDLVLLDLGLPDGSGWDLLPDLNALDERPAVVIFSAHTVTGEDAGRVEAALLKSRTTEGELLATLDRLLDEDKERSWPS